MILARISNLELLAQTVVDGFISGLHHAPYLGLSTDFAEHRPYLPGDDIRRIDWRVYGRTDRLYVREFEADTNANVTVLLDVSASMGYGSGAITKFDYARYLAASVLYLARTQRDRVGLITFAEGVVDLVPPAARHLEVALHTLDRAQTVGEGRLAPSLRKIAEIVRRRSILVLISDLYEEPDVASSALGLLRHKGNDVIAFHVLDPAERNFPFDEAAPFEDLETGHRVPVVPQTFRDEYRALVAAHVEALRRRTADAAVDYTLVDTARPLDHALFEYLARRKRLSRVR